MPDETLWAKRRLFLLFLFVYVTNISVYFKRNSVYSSIIILQARFGAAASSSVSADLRDSSSWVFLHLSVTTASFLTFSHLLSLSVLITASFLTFSRLYVSFFSNSSLFSNL